MATQSTGNPPNPIVILEELDSYQRTMALKGAIELDIFTQIADGAGTAAEIAKRCNASERGVRILCDFLTVQKLLTKTGNTYGLSPEAAAFLNKRSPAYIGSIAFFLAHDVHMAHYKDVAAAVRKGGSLDSGNMGPDDPIWVEFARSMAPLMRMLAGFAAPLVAQPGTPQKVLDIAAGDGMYGIAIAQQNRAAEVFAQDWKAVLAVAQANAEQAGVASRFHQIPGSAFDVDLGSGYDVVMLPMFLHHFDAPTNTALLKKIRAAMKPGAVLGTIEFIPNEDRVSPPVPATFSMMMLCSTPAGDAYTFRELAQMLGDAGFGENRLERRGPLEMIVSKA